MHLERARLLGTLIVLALAACARSPALDSELALGSESEFAQKVEPMLLRRCASGGCHGKPDRAFSLYAPGAQRVDPKTLYLDTPLTAAETHENFYRSAAFAQRCTVPACLLTCKPLAPSAGGCAHAGGELFPDQEDPDYRVLRSWVPTPSAADGGMP